MNPVRVFIAASVALFALIIGLGVIKKGQSPETKSTNARVVEVDFDEVQASQSETRVQEDFLTDIELKEDGTEITRTKYEPEIDRTPHLFNTFGPKLPIVHTVKYSSRVSWLKGRPAWIADYASHFDTTKHFIARSLTGKPDYFSHEISQGDRFNVLRNDLGFSFHLVVDIQKAVLWFYYLEPNQKSAVLLKTYPVELGRLDKMSPSGCLTPLGKYKLGSNIAVYKPGMMGIYRKRKTEMIRVFGTRWIPFSEEVSGCTAPAKGYGLHGMPWHETSSGKLEEDRNFMKKYVSDGCVRLRSDDMEELFSIIVTRPTTIEVVKRHDLKTTDIEEIEPELVLR